MDITINQHKLDNASFKLHCKRPIKQNNVLYGALKGIFSDCIALLVNNINTFLQSLKVPILKGFLTPTLYQKKIINISYFNKV